MIAGATFYTEDDLWSGKDRADENFPVGSILIRPGLRRHVHAFYRFARVADDTADGPSLSADDKLRRLDVMEAVLRHEQDHGSKTALQLRESLEETGVTAEHACDLLHAFRQDVRKSRYETWSELATYCRYSAMPVGRHVLDLHGEHMDSYAPSDSLSAALQVLNHLQDAATDLRSLDRCYLPHDLLASVGAKVDDLRQPALTPALRAVFERLLDLVDAWNNVGATLPSLVRDRRLRIEAGIISTLSYRLQRRLRLRDPLATRVKLTWIDGSFALLSAVRNVPQPAAVL